MANQLTKSMYLIGACLVVILAGCGNETDQPEMPPEVATYEPDSGVLSSVGGTTYEPEQPRYPTDEPSDTRPTTEMPNTDEE